MSLFFLPEVDFVKHAEEADWLSCHVVEIEAVTNHVQDWR
jgi:hypothetical protein